MTKSPNFFWRYILSNFKFGWPSQNILTLLGMCENWETELVFNDSLPNLHLYFFVEFQQPQQPLSGPEANSPFINRTTSRNGGRGSNMMEMPPPLPVANAGKITFLSTSLDINLSTKSWSLLQRQKRIVIYYVKRLVRNSQ